MEGMVPYTQAAVERAMKVPLLLTKNFALAYTNLFPLIDRAGCLGSRFEVLFHERQAMGDEPTEYIRVEQDDDSDDRAESYGVPGDEAENDAFVADLLGGGGGDGDGLGVDHFSHHASGTVGGAHEDGRSEFCPRGGQGEGARGQSRHLETPNRQIFSAFLIFSDFFGRQDSECRGQVRRGGNSQ